MKHSLALLFPLLSICAASLYFGQLKHTKVSSFELPHNAATYISIFGVNGQSNDIFLRGTDLSARLNSLFFYVCRNNIMLGSIRTPGGRTVMSVRDGDMLILGKDFTNLRATEGSYCPSKDLEWVQNLDTDDIFVATIIDRTLDLMKPRTREAVISDSSSNLVLNDQKRDFLSGSLPLKSEKIRNVSKAPNMEEKKDQPALAKESSLPKSVEEKNQATQKGQGVKRSRSPEPTQTVKKPRLGSASPTGIEKSDPSNSLVNRIKARIDMPLTDSNTGRYIPTVTVCSERDFLNTHLIGKGDYGKVYSDWWHGNQVAIKVIPYQSESELEAIRQEEAVLAEADHPGIPKLYGVYAEDGIVGLVMEHRGDSIRGLMLSQEKRREVVKQLVEILEYLHSNQIYHRDVKMGNITFRNTWSGPVVSLVDFGIACGGDPENPTFGGIHFLRGSDDGADWLGVAAVMDGLGCCGKLFGDPHAMDLRNKVGSLRKSERWTYRNGNMRQIKDHPFLKD